MIRCPALVLALALGPAAAPAFSAQVPQPSREGDPRVRYAVYHPDEVYQLTAFFGYHIVVNFSPNERVTQISAGYADAWDITNQGSAITVKPKEQQPNTSLYVVTSRRTYSFDIRLKQPRGPVEQDPDQMFVVRFQYPQDEKARSDEADRQAQLAELRAQADAARRAELAALPPPPKYINYLYEGDERLVPLELWDDGVFTYMRFPANTELPAIFIENEDGTENVVNKHFEADVMVVQRIAKRFFLRKGKTVACIYNENKTAPRWRSPTGTTVQGGERFEQPGWRP